jgi:hypothetical protein
MPRGGVALYLRRTGDGRAEAAESRRLSAYAAHRRWRVRALYWDADDSHRPTERRAFWAMRAAVTMGVIPRVLVKSRHTISADPILYERCVLDLRVGGCEIVICPQTIADAGRSARR